MADGKERNGGGSPEIDLAPPLEDKEKTRWQRSWPTIACGAGLFSDGKGTQLLRRLSILHFEFYSNHCSR